MFTSLQTDEVTREEPNSTIIMSSSSTSDDQLSNLPPSRIGASRNYLLDNTASTSRDGRQALSLPTCLPLNVQHLLIIIQHLLLTNDPPSAQHSVIISKCVRLIDTHVARLDAAMALTSSAKPYISTTPLRMPLNRSASIDEQKTQRADLQRFRERVQSMDSVVRRLPQEIWQEVFLFVRAHGEWVDIFDLRDSVYTVGQVCQQWRRASQSCPRLWSRILILVSRLVDVPQGESHLRTVLERSRSVPLDFGLDCGRRIVSAPETHARMLSVLMQHSSRWRSAEFSAMSLNDALLLENVRGRVPELESITLSEVCLQRTGSERIVTSAFEIAPKLMRVDLHFVTLGRCCWTLVLKRTFSICESRIPTASNI
ncbi:hypothetical protein BDZ89DRAFT_121277 [Hymenopellis radicata]|nr:hypothetical protein BDZ89DRAFT_121277 [Hymenopellis radicata]